MSTKNKIAKATLIIIVLSFVGKILGIVREMVIAAVFGTSFKTDAYFVGLTGPDFIREIVAGGVLVAVFIPVYTSCLSEKTREYAHRILNSITTYLVALLALVVVAGIPLAPWLVRVIAPELDPRTFSIAVTMTRIIFPSVVFMGLTTYYGSLLNIHKMFGLPSLAPLMLNVGIIAGAAALGSILGVQSLAIGFLFGALLQLLVLLPFVRSLKMPYSPSWEVYPEMKKMMALWVPLFFASFASTANDLVSRALAAGLPSGNIAALNFANRIRETTWLLCGVPLGTAVFPFLSSHAANGEKKELGNITAFAVRLTSFLAIPLCCIMLVFSTPIIRLVFERGSFDAQSTAMTASALMYFSVGSLFYTLIYVVLRVYYSMNNVAVPLKTFLAAFAINFGAAFLLRERLSVGGIALARSIADLFAFGLLFWGIADIFIDVRFSDLLKEIAKITAAAFVSTGLAFVVYQALPLVKTGLAGMAALGAAMGVFALAYAALSYALRIEEMHSIVNIIRRKNRT